MNLTIQASALMSVNQLAVTHEELDADDPLAALCESIAGILDRLECVFGFAGFDCTEFLGCDLAELREISLYAFE